MHENKNYIHIIYIYISYAKNLQITLKMQNSFNTSKISFKGPYVVKNDKIIHVTINVTINRIHCMLETH